MLLLKAHFLSICEAEQEELWGVKCEIGSAAVALALHRDPGAWKMDQDEIRRRRWAWWNYIVLERWQAFLVGSIALSFISKLVLNMLILVRSPYRYPPRSF